MSVAKLCEELCNMDIDIEVLTTRANGKNELAVNNGQRYIIDGVPVRYFHRLTKDHTHFSPSLIIALYKNIKVAKEHKQLLLIHVHSWWNMVAILSTMIGLCLRIPLVLSPRGMITSYTLGFKHQLLKRIFHNSIGRYMLRRVSIHTTSLQETQNIQAYNFSCPTTVISNLVDLPDPKVLTKQEIQKRVLVTAHDRTPSLKLLFLSRIDPKKGLELLFEALRKVEFTWQLRIAGDGDSNYVEELQCLSKKLQIQNHITWLGHLDNDCKYKVMQQHDLLVLTSKNENFANVIIEALASGIPVLISDKVGLAPYIMASDLGWVCKTDPDNIHKILTSIYQDPIKRNYIRLNAPAQILHDFDTNIIINKYLKLYKTVLNSS